MALDEIAQTMVDAARSDGRQVRYVVRFGCGLAMEALADDAAKAYALALRLRGHVEPVIAARRWPADFREDLSRWLI